MGLAVALSSAAVTVTAMTLNLHGYHPMGERQRWQAQADGTLRPRDPDPFLFTLDELRRGTRRQLDTLAGDVAELAPDVIALQEVAAGLPGGPLDCAVFERPAEGRDELGVNTAERLALRLANAGYTAYRACRGNVGWVTDADTVGAGPIGWRDADGRLQAVFPAHADAYPHGMLVEGFALLVRSPWRVHANRVVRAAYGERGEQAVFQQAVIVRPDGRWLVVVNVHAGHKVVHFEQAVAIRRAVAEAWPATARELGAEAFAGTIMLGDFNAYLYRPTPDDPGEISTAPWELARAGVYDLTSPDAVRRELPGLLVALNADAAYKPWASLPPAEAARRVHAAVDGLAELLQSQGAHLRSTEALAAAQSTGRCAPPARPEAACVHAERIDHIFFSQELTVEDAFVIYPRNAFDSAEGTTDHPGIVARLTGAGG
jgi:endonuclease/exonuclease/phosphatase family metal-dependent hydrolase